MVYNNFLGLDVDSFYPEPTNEQFLISFFNRIYVRLHIFNFSLLVIWYGRHRSGKSISSLVFSVLLDPTFIDNLESRVVYNVVDLKKQARIIRDKGIKGASIIYDEAGSGDLSNQRWYEEKAKRINAVLQSIGYLNPFINFVTQDFFFLNSQARKLSQGVFECKRTNNKYTVIKPFWISNDPWSAKIYHKYPIFCESINDDVVSNIYKIGKIRLGMILDDDTIARYEELSKAFKNKLLDEDEPVSEERDVIGVDTITEAVNDIISNPEPVLSKWRAGVPVLNQALIQHEYNVPYHVAGAIKIKATKALIENKKSFDT